jgi:hypothetical protein
MISMNHVANQMMWKLGLPNRQPPSIFIKDNRYKFYKVWKRVRNRKETKRRNNHNKRESNRKVLFFSNNHKQIFVFNAI